MIGAAGFPTDLLLFLSPNQQRQSYKTRLDAVNDKKTISGDDNVTDWPF